MKKAREIVARNIQIIMDHRGWNDYEVERQAKRKGYELPQKTVYNIRRGRQSAGLDKLEAFAAALGVKLSLLCEEELPEDLAVTPSLSKLYKSYITALPDGRRMIETVAEREAEYAKKANNE